MPRARQNKSKFLAESEQTGDATALVLAPNLSALIFSAEGDEPINEKQIERLNLPTMIKPGQVPIWTRENPVFLRGTIVKICPSPSTAIKGKLLWLKMGNGTEITFPCTGVIRNALAPGIKDDSDKLEAALEKFVGKELLIKRTPDKTGGKYNKAMFMFEVAVVKK